MLQAPSHLSRVCGHSHIKKFWLMQTQNESQACENKSALLASSSRPVPSSSGEGPDSKQSPQRSSSSPSTRSLLTGASPSPRPVRPLLAGGYSAVSAAGRHASLVTCAESFSPPFHSSDHSYRSLRPSTPELSAGNTKEENDPLDAEGVDCNRFKAPLSESDLSASSSRCGSPSEDQDSPRSELDLADSALHEAESAKETNLEPHITSHPATSYTSGRDFALTFKEDSLALGDEDVPCNLVTIPQKESIDLSKDLGNSALESHSLEVDNSDSGTDAGNFEYLRSPVRGARTVLLEKRGRPVDAKAFNGWMSSMRFVPKVGSGKGVESPDICREDFPSSNRETSSEDANAMRNSALRTCSLCGTTKTPLWRSGPHGPKSLCNACGIRFKKSKRCSGQSDGSELLASPLASPDATKTSSRPLKRKQETLLACERHWPRDSGSEIAAAEVSFQHQKRSRWPKFMMKREIPQRTEGILHSPSPRSASSRKFDSMEFENLADVEDRRTVSRVIAKDEEEAAVLLMYLSCGLVYA